MPVNYYLGITNDASATLKTIDQKPGDTKKIPLELAFKADSRDEECFEWIELQSWSFGASNAGSFGVGSGGGSGKASLQDFHFTMHPSTATPDLFRYCCTGEHYKGAFIIAKKSGGKKTVHYLRYFFRDLIISSYQTGGSGGNDSPSDSISFNFAAMTLSFTSQNADGSKAASVDRMWNQVRSIETMEMDHGTKAGTQA
jgi:type VI secretion system secreted protein Hcp